LCLCVVSETCGILCLMPVFLLVLTMFTYVAFPLLTYQFLSFSCLF
jgi:hypothetical protein